MIQTLYIATLTEVLAPEELARNEQAATYAAYLTGGLTARECAEMMIPALLVLAYGGCAVLQGVHWQETSPVKTEASNEVFAFETTLPPIANMKRPAKFRLSLSVDRVHSASELAKLRRNWSESHETPLATFTKQF